MEIQKQFNLSIVRWQLFAKMNNGENRSKCLLAIWVLFLHFTYKNLFLPIGIFLFWICPWLRFHSYSDFKTVISVNFQNTGISSRFSESNFMKYTKSGIRVHTISMNRIKRLTASRRFDFRICISYSIPWMDRISKQDETKHRNTNKQNIRTASHVRFFPNVHHRHIIGYWCLRGIIFLMLYFHVFSTN